MILKSLLSVLLQALPDSFQAPPEAFQAAPEALQAAEPQASSLPDLFSQALAGEPSRTRIRAENDDGAEEIEISLAPDRQGKKMRGVVGSVFRV